MQQFSRVLLLAVCLAVIPLQAHAASWSVADVAIAIHNAAQKYGVSEALLGCMVHLESSGNPYAVGAAGELGNAQLHPQGELVRFRALGYVDPFNPHESIDFMAMIIAGGGGRAWTTLPLCL